MANDQIKCGCLSHIEVLRKEMRNDVLMYLNTEAVDSGVSDFLFSILGFVNLILCFFTSSTQKKASGK